MAQLYYISLSQNIQGSAGGKPDFFAVLVKVVYFPILGEPFSFFACLHGKQDMGVAVANARFTGRWLCAVDGKVGYLIVILQSGHGKSASSRIGIRLVVDQKTAVSFLEMFISCIYANGIFRRKIKGNKTIYVMILFSVFGTVLLILRGYVFTWIPDFVPAVFVFTLYAITICQTKWWTAVSWGVWILWGKGSDLNDEVLYSNGLVCQLVLAINLLFLLFEEVLAREKKVKEELNIQSQLIDLQIRNQDEVNNMYRNILSLKHDMNNHMQLGRLFLLT